jgi:hypothetical protein
MGDEVDPYLTPAGRPNTLQHAATAQPHMYCVDGGGAGVV